MNKKKRYINDRVWGLSMCILSLAFFISSKGNEIEKASKKTNIFYEGPLPSEVYKKPIDAFPKKPIPLDKWVQKDLPTDGYWEIHKNRFSAIGYHARISRKFSFPDQTRIDFDLSWKETHMGLTLSLFSKMLDMDKLAGDDYRLNISPYGLNLKYAHTTIGKIKSGIFKGRSSKRPIKMSLLIEKTNGTFALYIDGKLTAQFEDPNGFNAEGDYFTLYPSGSPGSIHVENLIISKWDGVIPKKIKFLDEIDQKDDTKNNPKKKNIFYKGPLPSELYKGKLVPPNKWIHGKGSSGKWKIRKNQFISVGRSGSIGRKIIFPNKTRIDFDLSWKNSRLCLDLSLFAKTLGVNASERYRLAFLPVGVSLERLSSNQGFMSLGSAKFNEFQKRTSDNPFKVTLLIDKIKGTFSLYIDGELISEWKEPKEIINKEGGVILFFNM